MHIRTDTVLIGRLHSTSRAVVLVRVLKMSISVKKACGAKRMPKQTTDVNEPIYCSHQFNRHIFLEGCKIRHLRI